MGYHFWRLACHTNLSPDHSGLSAMPYVSFIRPFGAYVKFFFEELVSACVSTIHTSQKAVRASGSYPFLA